MATLKERLLNLNTSSTIDFDAQFKKIAEAQEGETVITGDGAETGDGFCPTIACKNNGCIELFVNSKVGIRLDPKYESITFFAPNVQFFTERIDFNTGMVEGMRWNKFPLNLTLALVPGVGTILPYSTLPEDIVRLTSKVLG